MQRPLAAFAFVCALSRSITPALAGTVYSNDFETNTNGFSSASTTVLPTDAGGFSSAQNSRMLGRFANDTVTLSLSGLIPGIVHTVAFDLFIGASWDGNDTSFGPDRWQLTVAGIDLVDATFANLSGSTQSYSDATPTGPGTHAASTGADVVFVAGLSVFDRYSIYSFSKGARNPVLTFTPLASTASLSFEGSSLQAVGDEFWAIDNVEITTATVVPEPSTLAGSLLDACFAGLVAARRLRATR
ncbi:MAG: hypothetical protein SFX72_02705 [Isosphaeraceae bacterium]|nr:hypothetical protein [Isosphaeraceae bacterium]